MLRSEGGAVVGKNAANFLDPEHSRDRRCLEFEVQ